MRENAIFLLELSSNIKNINSGSGLAVNKRSPQQMPVVVEHQPYNKNDFSKPSTSRSDSMRHHNLTGGKNSGKFTGKLKYFIKIIG